MCSQSSPEHLYTMEVYAEVSEWVIKFNTLRPRQNGRHFADDTFKCIFFYENVGISIKISLKFVPKGPINNIPALVQEMAWRLSGDKSLTEPMVVKLQTHICVTRPHWVNGLSWDCGKWGPYSPCKPSNHSLYIGIIIFTHIDNTQSTDHN